MTTATMEAPKMSKKRDRLDLRIEPETRERIERQARRFGLDLTKYIKQSVIRQLEQDEGSEPPKSKGKPNRG